MGNRVAWWVGRQFLLLYEHLIYWTPEGKIQKGIKVVGDVAWLGVFA